MSVISCKVYDDKIEIASDSITVRGSTQTKGKELRASKLIKTNNMIIGGVGFAEENLLFQLFCKTHWPNSSTEYDIIQFLSEFADWKNKKTNKYKIENDYIIIFDGKAYVTEDYLVREIIDYWAIGAGANFSLSALYLGNDVEKSVDVACDLSIYCERPIVKYIIKKT